ncbi:MAG: ABC transporter permease [Betaproteobacteria bacterium]|nr:ABC transporter permease [Betaproteobacteria bacterium]
MTWTLVAATLAASVAAGTSLLYAALGETLGERAGIINLGVEGVMLVGAACACAVASSTGSPYLGMLAGAVAGVVASAPFAYAVVDRAANQLASGLSLLFLGFGASALIGNPFVGALIPPLPSVSLRMPLGEGAAAVRVDFLVAAALPLAGLVAWLLMGTRWGLRLRAVGENPVAAFAAGCNRRRLQYEALAIAGMLSGLAGAHVALGVAYTWAEFMTGGRGFIAIALVMFARWNAWWAVAGALLFGAAEAAQLQLQAGGVDVSPFLMNMAPYLLTLALLPFTGKAGRLAAPAALGRPYRGVE